MPLSLRLKISSDVLGTQLEKNIVNLWKTVEDLRRIHDITEEEIWNLDEVPVWMDCNTGRTLEVKGKKRVKIRTNRRQKNRMTVILTVRADGKKELPNLIYKSLGRGNEEKKALIEKYQGRCFLKPSPKSSSNREIFLDYLNQLFPFVDDDRHKILIMDTSNTHGYIQSFRCVVGEIYEFLR